MSKSKLNPINPISQINKIIGESLVYLLNLDLPDNVKLNIDNLLIKLNNENTKPIKTSSLSSLTEIRNELETLINLLTNNQTINDQILYKIEQFKQCLKVIDNVIKNLPLNKLSPETLAVYLEIEKDLEEADNAGELNSRNLNRIHEPPTIKDFDPDLKESQQAVKLGLNDHKKEEIPNRQVTTLESGQPEATETVIESQQKLVDESKEIPTTDQVETKQFAAYNPVLTLTKIEVVEQTENTKNTSKEETTVPSITISPFKKSQLSNLVEQFQEVNNENINQESVLSLSEQGHSQELIFNKANLCQQLTKEYAATSKLKFIHDEGSGENDNYTKKLSFSDDGKTVTLPNDNIVNDTLYSLKAIARSNELNSNNSQPTGTINIKNIKEQDLLEILQQFNNAIITDVNNGHLKLSYENPNTNSNNNTEIQSIINQHNELHSLLKSKDSNQDDITQKVSALNTSITKLSNSIKEQDKTSISQLSTNKEERRRSLLP